MKKFINVYIKSDYDIVILRLSVMEGANKSLI